MYFFIFNSRIELSASFDIVIETISFSNDSSSNSSSNSTTFNPLDNIKSGLTNITVPGVNVSTNTDVLENLKEETVTLTETTPTVTTVITTPEPKFNYTAIYQCEKAIEITIMQKYSLDMINTFNKSNIESTFEQDYFLKKTKYYLKNEVIFYFLVKFIII